MTDMKHSGMHHGPQGGSVVKWATNEEIKETWTSASMFSPKFFEIRTKLLAFMHEHVWPAEESIHAWQDASPNRWAIPPQTEVLKAKAKAAGLWNLWLPKDTNHGAGGGGLTNLEYAPLCEIMGSSMLAPEIFNCNAPDTGNMEILSRFASDEVKDRFLKPLLNGEIRSCFGMTEPYVASSDATNISSLITRDGDHYVVNGRKWWTSGAMDPRCKVCIFMGKTDVNAEPHAQQSMVVIPMDAPGVTVLRHLSVYGYDDAPHGHAEVQFTNVRVPLNYILLEEGKGFQLSQARLGPGRIHHCMRSIGLAEVALALMIERTNARVAFKKQLAEQGSIKQDIARSRIEIENCRLLTLQTAHMIDTAMIKNPKTRQYVGMIKVYVPTACKTIVDRAVQAHGGAGVCQDTPLARMWAGLRTMQLADGPDEVHMVTIGKLEVQARAKFNKAKL